MLIIIKVVRQTQIILYQNINIGGFIMKTQKLGIYTSLGFGLSFFAGNHHAEATQAHKPNAREIIAHVDKTIAQSEVLRAQGSQVIETSKAKLKEIDKEIAASTAIRGMR